MRIYIAGHRGMVGSAILRRLQARQGSWGSGGYHPHACRIGSDRSGGGAGVHAGGAAGCGDPCGGQGGRFTPTTPILLISFTKT